MTMTKTKHRELYDYLQTEWGRLKGRWNTISDYVGIMVDMTEGIGVRRDIDDRKVQDATAALAVNQTGDYLTGVLWGGDRQFQLTPTFSILQEHSYEEVQEFYQDYGDFLVEHFNNSSAGIISALAPHMYDQASFGTSGIGLFRNPNYGHGDDNLFVFKNYGVDRMRISEGANGKIDTVFVVHFWNGYRIKKELKNVPPWIVNDSQYKVVYGVYPKDDYSAKEGRNALKYESVWFLDGNDDHVFETTDHYEMPIPVARAIRVRGETYGRSYGTMLLSTIRGLNQLVESAVDTVEKMHKPAMATYNNAIAADGVIDTSSGALTVFKQNLLGGQPLFKLYDIDDPSAVLQIVMPYFRDLIISGFKRDQLLDFSGNSRMTMREVVERSVIRGQSVAGLLLQQKNELLEPLVYRADSIAWDEFLRVYKKDVPEAVLELRKQRLRWFKIQWKTDLEKLVNTAAKEAMLSFLQVVGAISEGYPQITEAVKWYELLSEVNKSLETGVDLLFTEDEFKKALQARAEAEAQAMQMQQASVAADIKAKTERARKYGADADAKSGAGQAGGFGI